MMLRTVACEPASWAAMLPQKFSAATTLMVPEPDGAQFPQAVASKTTAPRIAKAKMAFLRASITARTVRRTLIHLRWWARNPSSIPVAHVTCASLLRYNASHAQTQPGSRPGAERLATRVDDRGAAGACPQGRGDRGLFNSLSRRVLPGGEEPDPQGRPRRDRKS